MSDYISREAAIKALCERSEPCFTKNGEPTFIGDYIGAINDIPAADVVEVRHGRWANGAFGYGHYWCTVCQKEVWSEEEKTNFCPDCGADMRGGVNDGANSVSE